MPTGATALARGGDVRAATSYAKKDGVERPYGEVLADERLVVFHDMRGTKDQPALWREGFALVHHPTAVTDFADHDQILTRYFPEIGELARRMTGAEAVFLQPNWVFRGDDREVATESVSDKHRVTTMKSHGVLHADYYEAGTAESLATMSMQAAGVVERPPGRLVGINTWRGDQPPTPGPAPGPPRPSHARSIGLRPGGDRDEGAWPELAPESLQPQSPLLLVVEHDPR